MSGKQEESGSAHPARHWRGLADERVQCDLCPRHCRLAPGERGVCFVRANEDGRLVLTTYGRSSGFCVDPIEKKPLHHFLPGTPVLSFGTAGCNLTCRFCQNWDISKAREFARLSARASPERIAATAQQLGCRSVAFTYNDPVVFFEYAVDAAHACRELGIRTVAVTAGYICEKPREEFFAVMDAANVDLKGFDDGFYRRLCSGRLAPVLETLEFVHGETSVWLELTTLLIPGWNDTDAELGALVEWVGERLGPDVPLHFSAFHPAWEMTDVSATPVTTLSRAREIALRAGLHHVYTGNVRDPEGESTFCAGCGALLVGRDGYELTAWNLAAGGTCGQCGRVCAGVFEPSPGSWGRRQMPVRVE